MKLFLVMSDSHGDLGCLRKIIDAFPAIGSVIHLGDYVKDAAILKGYFPDKEYFLVPGNCDSGYKDFDGERSLDLEGMKILLTHGHRYGVKYGLENLKKKAANDRYDIVLYGHTHIPDITKAGDCLLINPGSAGYPRYDGPPTYALLEINNGKTEARIMEVI